MTPQGPSGTTIRVLVVDDHQMVRVGLRTLLERNPDICVVGEAADGQSAISAVAEYRPDVVLMDLSMPILDGVAATAQLRTSNPDVVVLALTTFADRDHVVAAIDAGALGYLLKDCQPDELTAAVRAAARGEAPLDPRAALALVRARQSGPTPDPLAPLRPREREVLALVAQGMSNRLVARKLGISEKTVKTHLTAVFAAIGVTDRLAATLWWQRNQ